MGRGWVDQVYQFNASDPPWQQNLEGLLDQVDSTHDRVELVYDRVEQFKWFEQLERMGRWLQRRLERLEQSEQSEQLEQLEQLGLFERLELFELFELLELLDRERRDLLDMERRDLLEHAGSRWFHQSTGPTALEMIARSRLNLYKHTGLHPDPVALTLFLCQHNKEIFNHSRRLFLESFKSPSLPHPDTAEREVDLETARKLYSAVFDSKAIGDLTKWRLLAGVLFPEWETLPTEWKDLLAAEVIKVDWAEDQQGGWMVRVTPLLDRRFNLYEFGLAEVDNTYGRLAPTHLDMVATVVEHLGAEGLTQQKARELDRLLLQHESIFCDERVEVESRNSDIVPTLTPLLQTGALSRIQTVISQVEARYSQSRNWFA
jgi:hypothetical protein